MSTEKPTAFIFCDKRHVKKNGNVSIKLYVDFMGTRKTYKLPIAVNANDWNKIQSGKKIQKEELKEIKSKIFYYSGEKFEKVIREIELWDKPFSFKLFEEFYFGTNKAEKHNKSIFDAYDRKIKRLEEAGKIGSSETCRGSKKSLNEFRNNLSFIDITTEFLNDYENFILKKKKLSPTTLGIYLRELRSIINEAMNVPINPIRMEYPFSKNQYDKKYKIPLGRNTKKSLSKEEIDKIKNYETTNESERKAIDYWLFSYYCNGINFADIAYLTYNNIENEHIIFRRKKTENTNKNSRYIKAYINPQMKKIIKRWGNPIVKTNYIFPIFQPDITPEREHQLIKQFTRWTNGYLKELDTKLNLSQRVSTIHARHSFATILKNNNTESNFIQDSLGHSNVKTTENYLGGFTDEAIKTKSGLL